MSLSPFLLVIVAVFMAPAHADDPAAPPEPAIHGRAQTPPPNVGPAPAFVKPAGATDCGDAAAAYVQYESARSAWNAKMIAAIGASYAVPECAAAQEDPAQASPCRQALDRLYAKECSSSDAECAAAEKDKKQVDFFDDQDARFQQDAQGRIAFAKSGGCEQPRSAAPQASAKSSPSPLAGEGRGGGTSASASRGVPATVPASPAPVAQPQAPAAASPQAAAIPSPAPKPQAASGLLGLLGKAAGAAKNAVSSVVTTVVTAVKTRVVPAAVSAATTALRTAGTVVGLYSGHSVTYTGPKLRGVNLGGWLVLEKWMEPSVFAGTSAEDEYTFSQTPGAAVKLEKHHQTWITEPDFKWLKDHGVNAVRIPVGYWIFGDASPYVGGIKHLDWAFSMADKYGLRVLLDLHGAPGSQNGQDHSGKKGSVGFYTSANQALGKATLNRLLDRYGSNPALWGIELLNEPNPGFSFSFSWANLKAAPGEWALISWTKSTIDALSKLGGGYQLVFSDEYAPNQWSGISGNSRAIMDVHHYQCFSDSDAKKTLAQHVSAAEAVGKDIAKWQKNQPVIIGEWSLTLHSLSGPDVDKQFAKAQLDAYQNAAGWFFWSYKTEGNNVSPWDFRSEVNAGNLKLQ